MKKFILALAIICSLTLTVSIANVSADTLSLPLSLPATINSVTYQHAVVNINGTLKEYVYYNNRSDVQFEYGGS